MVINCSPCPLKSDPEAKDYSECLLSSKEDFSSDPLHLLALSVIVLTMVTHYGAHFSVISGVSLEANPYRIVHNVVFYSGICLSVILVLAALLSTVATVRESVCLMAMGFFCFAIVFCALIQAAFWRHTNNSEVEDAMMDVYDSVYEEVRRNLTSFRRQELATIHETDCLQEIQGFLKKHMGFISTLLIITVCFMVYGMVLTSFLLFSIYFSSNLDRKGKYILRERERKHLPNLPSRARIFSP